MSAPPGLERKDASSDVNPTRYARARLAAFERLEGWAKYKRPNYCLYFCSAIYVIACVVVFGIGYAVLNEVETDAKANVAFTYITRTEGRPAPCGLPTPDAIHLLQAFDRYESSFGLPQLLEPSYSSWVKQIKSAMCAGDVYWTSDGNDGNVASDATEQREDHARELRTIAQLTRNWTLAPAIDPTTNTITDETVAWARANLTANACQDYVNDNREESFYSHRLRTAYGDLFTRVARAYVAAAPAFYQYQKLLEADSNDQGCLGDRNPFLDSVCENSDHIATVMGRAGTAAASEQLAGTVYGAFPTEFSEMVYALLGLAVVGHVDRTANNGNCFRNTMVDDDDASDAATLANNDARSFCASIYDDEGSFTDAPYSLLLPTDGYAKLDATMPTCVHGIAPPPPPHAPPFSREVPIKANGLRIKGAVIDVCANLLQYGLFEQGRLFGVPDILKPFVVDARVGPAAHVLAPPIYNGLFLDTVRRGGTAFYEPLRRLEAYLVYRLASVAIWGMLIGSVVGFFLTRAATPVAIGVMRVFKIKNKEGESPFLTRPSLDTSTFLASIFAVLAGYWTLYTDPAVQSHYPTTESCKDWIIGEDHSASGAYVTSWGKRRFSRYGEQQIGVVLFALAGLPLIYSAVATAIDPRIKFWRERKIPWVTRDNVTFWILFLGTIVSQAMLGWQATISGEAWELSAASSADTLPEITTLARDCRAAVMIAFWSGAAVGLARCRWTVVNLSFRIQVLWTVATLGLIWIQLLVYNTILFDEWQDAFKVPTADGGRLARIWVLVGSAIGQSLLILWNLKVLAESAPDAAKPAETQVAIKEGAQEVIQEKKEELQEQALLDSVSGVVSKTTALRYGFGVDRFRFQFSDAQLGAHAAAEETGYTTALPPAPLFQGRRQRGQPQYIPMLKFQH